MKRKLRALTPAEIDRCLAAETIREVRESLRGVEQLPASSRGLVLR
jgi:hypothetical protein